MGLVPRLLAPAGGLPREPPCLPWAGSLEGLRVSAKAWLFMEKLRFSPNQANRDCASAGCCPGTPAPPHTELLPAELREPLLHSEEGMLPTGPGEGLARCLAGDGWGLSDLGSRGCRAPAEVSPCGCLSLARAETAQDQSLGCRASSLLPTSGLLPTLIPHHTQACSTSLPSAL